MAGYHSSVIATGLFGAFIGWILAAQYAPIAHLLPYAFIAGASAGAAGCILMQSYGSRMIAADATAALAPTSALELSKQTFFDSELTALHTRRTYCATPIMQIPRPVMEPIDRILDAVVREHVETWLCNISQSMQFSHQVGHAIRSALSKAAAATLSHDLVGVAIGQCLPIFNDHLASFIEAESSVRKKRPTRARSNVAAEDLTIETATQFKSGHLHSAASFAGSKSPVAQQRHLRVLIEHVLREKLAPTLMRSPSVRVIVREIVACAVLCPLLRMLSDPDFIFQQIQNHGEALLKQPAAQLRRRRASLIRRRRLSDPTASMAKTWTRPSEIGLHDVLYDVAGLSYFMEFMDQYELVIYVQFWITTDGLQSSLSSASATHLAHPLDNLDKSWTESDRLLIQRVYERFLSKPKITPLAAKRDAVTGFLQGGSTATAEDYSEACLAILQAQADVYKTMETMYLPSFKMSDKYKLWVGSTPMEGKDLSVEYSPVPSNGSHRSIENVHNGEASISSARVTSYTKQQSSMIDSISIENNAALLATSRRSLDDGHKRRPLFQDEGDDSDVGSVSKSIVSHDADARRSMDEGDDFSGNLKSEVEDSRLLTAPRNIPRSSSEANVRKKALIAERISSDADRPSLNSLGLLGTPSRRTVFSTDDLFGESESLWEDEEPQANSISTVGDDVRDAKQGDLGLPEAIESLNLAIEKLEAQHKYLGGFLRKSELTNNTAELKILRRSVADVERDLRHQELQRQQYIVQRSDNSLFRKASASIAHVHVGREADGHEYAIYDVQLQRRGSESTPPASWTVTKRYSEFHELHRRLKLRFPYVREIPFPKRQVVPTLQTDLVQRRRAALEQYLGRVLTDYDVCQSLEIRSFLSEQPIRTSRSRRASAASNRQDIVARLYAALTAGLEDFVGNTSVLDQLSMAGHNLISMATTGSGMLVQEDSSGTALDAPSLPTTANRPLMAVEAQAEVSAFDHAKHADGDIRVTGPSSARLTTEGTGAAATFIGPIARCFSILFQTDAGNNWLRGRAVVIVLQQILGGTVERRVREAFSMLTNAENMSQYLSSLQRAVWPEPGTQTSRQIRSLAAKAQTQRDAEEVLCALFVENAGTMVGTAVARDSARRLTRCLANERLNLHLLYTVLDKMVPLLLDDGVEREP